MVNTAKSVCIELARTRKELFVMTPTKMRVINVSLENLDGKFNRLKSKQTIPMKQKHAKIAFFEGFVI